MLAIEEGVMQHSEQQVPLLRQGKVFVDVDGAALAVPIPAALAGTVQQLLVRDLLDRNTVLEW